MTFNISRISMVWRTWRMWLWICYLILPPFFGNDSSNINRQIYPFTRINLLRIYGSLNLIQQISGQAKEIEGEKIRGKIARANLLRWFIKLSDYHTPWNGTWWNQLWLSDNNLKLEFFPHSKTITNLNVVAFIRFVS